jgi:uncharacterized protein YegP (UPF0339 family)/TATA-box binding protein (TBP) (component of TFIID and TFIIIB)
MYTTESEGEEEEDEEMMNTESSSNEEEEEGVYKNENGTWGCCVRVDHEDDELICWGQYKSKEDAQKEIDKINKEAPRSAGVVQRTSSNPGDKKTSKYIGVFWDKSNKRWKTSLRMEGRNCHLGCYSNEDDAALVYKVASKHREKGDFKEWLDRLKNKKQVDSLPKAKNALRKESDGARTWSFEDDEELKVEKLFINLHKKKKSSKYLGVCWQSHFSKWRAQIRHDGKQITLGSFTDEKEAHEAYLKSKEQIENGTFKRSRKKQRSFKYKGVSWDTQSSKWRARIPHKGKTVFLGSFTLEEEAHEAYLKAEEQIEKGTFQIPEKKNNSSKYKGVYWESRKSKWRAQVMHRGKRIHLGRFCVEKEAHEADLKAQREQETACI